MSTPHDLEAILFAFAAEPKHDRSTLERYLRTYPDFAEDLVELSAELRLASVPLASTTKPIEDKGLEAAWQELMACKPSVSPYAQLVDPFMGFKGREFVKLAATLNVPQEFLAAFRYGLVVASSIPKAFAKRFADATHVTVGSARTFFAQSQEVPAGLAFKSQVKPGQQGRMTFRELVMATEMTDEQRRLLLQECDADGLD